MGARTPRATEGRSVRVARRLVDTLGTLAALAAFVSAATIMTGRYLWTAGGADPRRALVELPQLTQADVRPGRSFYLVDLDPWLRALCALPDVVAGVTIVLAMVYVVRVLDGVGRGDAFGAGTRRAVSRLGGALVLGGVLQGVLDTVAVAVLATYSSRADVRERVEALSLTPRWPWTLIVVGAVVLAVSAAFREGARLQRDVAGVI